jgi:hypothetical protein
MSDLDNFQKEHGDQWATITQHPAFGAAMSFLNLRKIAGIAALTDEQIESSGKLVLADLRGHLNHENDLINLATAQDFVFGEPLRETYPDPAEEAAAAAVVEQPEPQLPKKPRKRK